MRCELLLPLGPEAQVVVVVLEGQEVQALEPPASRARSDALLGLVEEEAEALVDEVAEEPELLFASARPSWSEGRNTTHRGAPAS